MRFQVLLLLVFVLLVAIVATPVKAQGWSITVMNSEVIRVGDNVSFAITGEYPSLFHLRIGLDNIPVAEVNTLSLPLDEMMSVNWTSPPSLPSGRYVAEVFLDSTEDVRVPTTIQSGDYLITAKIQKGAPMVCTTSGDPDWNELFQVNWTNLNGAYYFIACQNIADADDAGTLAGLQGDAVIYAVRGHSLDGDPEFQTASNSGAVLDADPPPITPTYPDFLTIAIGVAATDTVVDRLFLVAPPIGYTNVSTDTTADNQYLTSFASKASTGTENPSAFDFKCDGFYCQQKAGWGAATIAIPNGTAIETKEVVATTQFSMFSATDFQDLEQIQEEIERLKQEIAELREELARLGSNQTAINERLDDLESRLAELENLPDPGTPEPLDREWWLYYAVFVNFLLIVALFILLLAAVLHKKN